MKAMLVSTASSCGVCASTIIEGAPTVFWMVSSSVSPVNTRIVSVCSSSRSVAQLCTSLDRGTFSGSQKFAVSRFHTSRSFSSCSRFQLMASGTFRTCSLFDMSITCSCRAMAPVPVLSTLRHHEGFPSRRTAALTMRRTRTPAPRSLPAPPDAAARNRWS